MAAAIAKRIGNGGRTSWFIANAWFALSAGPRVAANLHSLGAPSKVSRVVTAGDWPGLLAVSVLWRKR